MKSPNRKIRGGNILRPVSNFPNMCSQGQKCISHKGKFYSVQNATENEECRILSTLDGIERGIYTYILFIQNSSSHTVEQMQTLLNFCECSWDTQGHRTRSQSKEACEALLPFMKVIVGKTYTVWERGTKHSCLLQCLQESDLLVGAGELNVKGNRIEANALSGTYMLSHLQSESQSRRLPMSAVNSLYLDDCIIKILRRMSPRSTVKPSTKDFITRDTTAATVEERLIQMHKLDIPVFEFSTMQECESNNPRIIQAKLTAKLKNDRRKLDLLLRIGRLSKDAHEQQKDELNKKYEGEVGVIKRGTRWKGTF
jgi:hypothetical protein